MNAPSSIPHMRFMKPSCIPRPVSPSLHNDTVVSTLIGVILMIALVVVLTTIIAMVLFGSVNPKYMQKSVYIAGTAKETAITQGALPYHLLTFKPIAGDPLSITGQRAPSGTPTTLIITGPDGRNLTPDASSLSGSLYGRTMYIYQKSGSNACQFIITDKVPNVNGLPPMVIGKYTIQLIDEKVHVLASSYPTDITKGTTSVPTIILTLTGTAVGYKSDCSQFTGTCPNGCPGVYNTSLCNKTYKNFNGNTFLTFPDDPTLKYTGDMSMAVTIRPTSTGASSNSANWHQIIGKDVTVGVNNENDNYELFQLGDRLYFEWSDANPPYTHYHAMTPTGIVQAGQWNQLNVVVNNNQLSIYHNGVSQPLTYYQSNVPGVNPLAASPGVRMQNNGNSVNIGKQNGGSGNQFYFKGDIGEISLYNRALSQTEITNNLCSG